MLPKYTVEYSTQFKRHAQVNHFSTDDPVACEEFVLEVLERGLKLHAIKREGVDLPMVEFDKMIRMAGEMLAARHICASLGIKSDEERFRIRFAA